MNWLNINNLNINLEKTEQMRFYQKRNKINNLNINYLGQKIFGYKCRLQFELAVSCEQCVYEIKSFFLCVIYV